MKGNMNNTSSPLTAFKRAPSLGLSQWENGNLTTNLAEKKDTNGAFFLVEEMLAPGTEPPPHVHTREDELFYVIEGEFDVYVGKEAFKVETGECVFLPRFKPHAFVIRSPQLRVLALFTPAGLEEVFRGMSTPAESLELPTGAVTYSTGDLKETAKRLREYGAHFLTPAEVTEQLPLYPNALPANASESLAASNGDFLAYQIAEVYAWRGETDKAFEWLQVSLDNHDTGTLSIFINPFMRGLRHDARYKSLLTKIGLPVRL
jgi:quercetin dioxygenase-like cupin family protein